MSASEERQRFAAADALRLRDIQLFDALFDRPTPIFSAEAPPARQEHMRAVQFVTGDVNLEDGESHTVVQFFVHLGTRVVGDTADAEHTVYFRIEAKFLVEYEIVDSLEQDALRAFADYSAVHNAWPFWRQHVYDIVQRSRLPHLDIPLVPGQRA
jgi:preprotein translocase subunit SecB